jgi:hypothetical protein
MSRRPALGLVLGVLGAASCGYYNGMWSADHFAAQARRQEHNGRRDEARASWAAAAVKAESVVAHHPHGHWADAALVLQGEGLAKSGACDRAAAPLAGALASVKDPALRERATLAAAECSLDARNATDAEQLLAALSASPRRAPASRAAYLSGRVAEERGDLVAAAGSYARSSDAQAGPARARVLLAAGRTAEALAFIDTLARGHFDEAVWALLLGAVGDGAGVTEASRALDHVLATGHVLTGSRARLLLADGGRLLAVDSLAAADARYQQVAAMVPDSSEGQAARVGRLRVSAAQAGSLAELRAVQTRVDRLAQAGTAGAALTEVRALQRLIQSVIPPGDPGEELPFQSAELARDSLRAPQLAVSLFLAFAGARPASVFAPKALIAAAALSPERRDSLMRVLDSTYGASPYTLALRGEPSPAYGAAEDSLARALGVVLERPSAFVASLISPPVPGPRGPPLDAAAPERAEPPRLRGRLPVRGDDAPQRDERRGPPPQEP